MIFGLTNMFLYNLTYLLLEPAVTCNGEPCDLGKACEEGIQFEIDESDPNTLTNWLSQLDAQCFSGFKIGLFGSLYFVGFTTASALIKYGDKIGRRNFLLLGAVVAIFVNAWLIFYPNQYARYSGMLVAGLLAYKIVVSYVFCVDFFPSSCAHIVAAGQFFCDQVTG